MIIFIIVTVKYMYICDFTKLSKKNITRIKIRRTSQAVFFIHWSLLHNLHIDLTIKYLRDMIISGYNNYLLCFNSTNKSSVLSKDKDKNVIILQKIKSFEIICNYYFL